MGYANLANLQCSTGSAGTCFSGGSGGGGIEETATSTYNANSVAFGGKGGDGVNQHQARVTGGAGNPNGTNQVNHVGGTTSSSSILSHNESGTGGIIWLIVGGNLIIGSTGLITAQGSRADGIQAGNGYHMSSGGGSGGGVIKIAYRGTFTNNGSINVSGGQGGNIVGAVNTNGIGGTGGAGSQQTLQVR